MKTTKITVKLANDPVDGDDHLWRISRDYWTKGEVTFFLKEQIAGLKDSNGKPLPDHAKQFFLDILFNKIKLPKSRKRSISNHAVKQFFEERLKLHKFNQMFYPERKQGKETPTEEAIEDTAKVFGVLPSAISEIIYPRSSRAKNR